MTGLTLQLRQSLRQRLDMRPFTPQGLAGKRVKEIGHIPLWLGNRQIETGELFFISGNDPETIVIRSDSDRLDHIGATMTSGRIRVEGRAGAYLGRSMSGGALQVDGDSGIFTGSGMSGGSIHIAGSAGDFLGAGFAGERHGMRGGRIVVAGNAGDRVGDQLRRGSILVGGDSGDYCASRMIAGTIVVLGRTGIQTGLAMRRGSLLLTHEPTSLPVTFNDNGCQNLGFLALLTRSFGKETGFSNLAQRGNRVRRWLGDLGCDGKGEVLVWE